MSSRGILLLLFEQILLPLTDALLVDKLHEDRRVATTQKWWRIASEWVVYLPRFDRAFTNRNPSKWDSRIFGIYQGLLF